MFKSKQVKPGKCTKHQNSPPMSLVRQGLNMDMNKKSKHVQVKASQARSSQINSRQVQSSLVNPMQMKSSQARANEVKSSQVQSSTKHTNSPPMSLVRQWPKIHTNNTSKHVQVKASQARSRYQTQKFTTHVVDATRAQNGHEQKIKTCSSQSKSSQVKSDQFKASPVKPGQPKANQVKSSQGK